LHLVGILFPHVTAHVRVDRFKKVKKKGGGLRMSVIDKQQEAVQEAC
jgi:hypothetical protein